MKNYYYDLNTITADEIELLIKDKTHEDIANIREALEAANNKNFLLRSLYYDYDKQCWIEPDRIKI